MKSQFTDMTSSSNFFDVVLFLLLSLATGPSFVSISPLVLEWIDHDNITNELTKNLEIRNTPIWVLLNIWGLGGVRDTKFGINVSNEMLLNAAKCQGCSIYCFCIIKRKPTEESKSPPPPLPPPRLGLTDKLRTGIRTGIKVQKTILL